MSNDVDRAFDDATEVDRATFAVIFPDGVHTPIDVEPGDVLYACASTFRAVRVVRSGRVIWESTRWSDQAFVSVKW